MPTIISSIFRSSRGKNHRSHRFIAGHLTLGIVSLILGAAAAMSLNGGASRPG